MSRTVSDHVFQPSPPSAGTHCKLCDMPRLAHTEATTKAVEGGYSESIEDAIYQADRLRSELDEAKQLVKVMCDTESELRAEVELQRSGWESCSKTLHAERGFTKTEAEHTRLQQAVVEAAKARRVAEVAMFPFNQTPQLALPHESTEGSNLLAAFTGEQNAVDELMKFEAAHSIEGEKK